MAGTHALTRRSMLAGILAVAARGAPVRDRVFPSERFLYSDPATEFPVLRLTSPEHTSRLPEPPLRGVSRGRAFLIYASDRTGSPQLFRMSGFTGESRQATAAADLDPVSFALAPDDRSVFFFDGAALRQTWLAGEREREREHYRVPEGWRRGPGFSVTPEGAWAFLMETDGRTWRLRRIALREGQEPATVLETDTPLDDPAARPRHDDVLYRQGPNTLWLASPAHSQHSLALAPGSIGQAYWSGDGDRVIYLSRPAQPGALNAIRECTPDSGADTLVAATSQFAAFSPNGDASVFIGASANRASPNILLLLRVTRRELTLCEHRASDPARAAPVFSPDSQRIYFHSDRHGRPAIYSMVVERLVERTQA
ncbi:MAG: hypothetical protein ABSD56_01025 [Bryobacteraceae bacterium]